MELKEFIKTVLIEIIDGVELAQKEIVATNRNAIINPTIGQMIDIKSKFDPHDLKNSNEVKITATVAVTQSDGGNFGLSIIPIKATTNKENKNETTTSISFVVPVVFPVMNHGE